MQQPSGPEPVCHLFDTHPRSFQANRYVYPVLSRRAGGISIGVNLSADKGCNFHCVYCQVNRQQRGQKQPVDVGRLAGELQQMVELVTSGRIYRETEFGHTPPPLRRLSDIALSGDGEPTACANFDEVVAACAAVRRRHRLEEVKLVLITNASLLHEEKVLRALEVLDQNGGEIWAKLDAGTEAYYRQVARTGVPFRQILKNLCRAAVVRPIVVQSLFVRIHGQPPAAAEQEAYAGRLGQITAAGGRIKLVQIHTIARPPAESWVTALSRAEVDTLAETVRRRTGLPVATY